MAEQNSVAKENTQQAGNSASSEIPSQVAGSTKMEKIKVAILGFVIAALAIAFAIYDLNKNKGDEDKEKDKEESKSKTEAILNEAITVKEDEESESTDEVIFLKGEWFDDNDFTLEEPEVPEEEIVEDEFFGTGFQDSEEQYSGQERDGGRYTGDPAPRGQRRSQERDQETWQEREYNDSVPLDINSLDDGFTTIEPEVVLTPDQQSAIDARKKSSIIFKSGSTTNSDFLSFGDMKKTKTIKKLENTGSAQVKATKIGNMNRVIAQGKMIPVILESSIDTNLPGTIRAIVSRDVYSESGKNILIGKGARVIGNYNALVHNGQARVGIIWNRLIMTNGIDVKIDSDTIDELGKTGTPGELHTKWFSKILQATLVTAVPVAISRMIPNLINAASDEKKDEKKISEDIIQKSTDAINKLNATIKSGGISTQQQSGVATEEAILKASEEASAILQDVIRTKMGTEQYITLEHGSRIYIFVNKDLVFPEEEKIILL